MKLIKCEKQEKSIVELQFSVDAETFKAAVDKAFKRECKKYNVPGFRRGKAPRAIIEKMFGADVFHYPAINDLFPENYDAAVAEAGIQVVGQPEPEIVSESLEDGFVIKALVPVQPVITLGEYAGIEVTKKIQPVTDQDVADELDRMQQRNGRQLTREGTAQMGDVATIDFEGFLDNVAFEGGKGEKYPLTLGSGSFIPGFEDQIIGHSVGDEFDVNVTFPTEYQEDLAGKDATFKVKVHEITYKELPELDDEFAKDVSEFDTLDELKADIRSKLEEQRGKQADTEVENALVEKVVSEMQGDIPEAMYDSRCRDLAREYEIRLQQNGLKLEQYMKYTGQTMEQLLHSFRGEAEKQVKTRLALDAIVASEQISVSDEEAEEEIKKIAEAYKMEIDAVKGLVNVEDIKKDLAANKALDLLKQKANIIVETVAEGKAEEQADGKSE